MRKSEEPQLSPELLQAQRTQRLLTVVGVAALLVSVVGLFVETGGSASAEVLPPESVDSAPDMTGYEEPQDDRVVVPSYVKKPLGNVSTDLCRALDEGERSDLVYLTDYVEEQRFAALLAALHEEANEEDGDGVALRRLPERDGRQCYRVLGRARDVEAVLELECIEGLWHIVACPAK